MTPGRRIALAAAVLSLATSAGTAGASDPALDYMLHCQGCHLADGGGTPGSVPPLAGHVSRFLARPGGREYLVRVPGVAQSVLDDARLAALLNWLVRRFDPDHVPATFRPFGSDEIADLRKRPLTDVEPLRARLLETTANPEHP